MNEDIARQHALPGETPDAATSLYDLIAPEYLALDHQLHIHQGFQALGVETLREALDAGFVQLCQEGSTTGQEPLPEGGLLIHEDALPQLQALIAQVATLRRAAFSESVDAASAGPTASTPAATSEAPAQTQSPSSLAREKSALAEVMTAHFRHAWPLVDHHQVAKECLGEGVTDSPPEDLLELYYSAVKESFGCAKAALVEEITGLYQSKLARYKQASLGQRERRALAQSLQKSWQETSLPAWRAQEEEWQQQLEETIAATIESTASKSPQQQHMTPEAARASLQRILTHTQGKAQRFIQEYWGETSLEQALVYLDTTTQARQQEVEALLQRQRNHAAFQRAYHSKSSYASHFSIARTIKRKLYYFAGPTNSGKTHAAFEELLKSKSGVYLAPLRLLALEGQQKLLARGVKASFLTGEERDLRHNAPFVASTIEMLNTSKAIGCAIIDEAQLLSHPQRGWAWTHAIVGAPAYQVVMTGPAHAIPAIQKIAASLQETLEVRHFERFNPLHVMDAPVQLHEIQPATAVICFSRKEVLALKREIEATTPHRAAVIYGALSPDVRRAEARRFRDGHAQVLVATDAIGMGLNLPIQHILFWRTEKTSAGITRPLTPEEIQQIAGRAGRYGLADHGQVGAFNVEDLHRVQQGLSTQIEAFTGPFPASPHPTLLDMLAEAHQTEHLPQLLQYFQTEVWFERDLFFPMITQTTAQLAAALEDTLDGCPLHTKYTFARAPINPRHARLLQELTAFAAAFAQGHTPTLSPHLVQPYLLDHTENPDVLQDAEHRVQLLTLYRWLAYRFPQQFRHAEHADNYRHILNRYISRSLQHQHI